MIKLPYRRKENPDPVLVQTRPIYRFLWNEVSIEKGSKRILSASLPKGIDIDIDNKIYNPYEIPLSVKIQKRIVEESRAYFLGVENHNRKERIYLISLDATKDLQTDLIDDTGNFMHLGFVQMYSENSGQTPILLYRSNIPSEPGKVRAKRTDSFEDYCMDSSNIIYDDKLKAHILSKKQHARELFERKRFSKKLNELDISKLEELADEDALLVVHTDINDRLIRIVRELVR